MLTQWKECSEERFYEALNCLPPRMQNGPVLGYARQYSYGRWVFKPSVASGKRAINKRFGSFEACLPDWTGGLDATRSEWVESTPALAAARGGG